MLLSEKNTNLEEQYVYPSTKERIVLRSFFLLFAAGAVCGRMVWSIRSLWRRPFIRSVGLENRIEKQLKSGLELLNPTSWDSKIASLVNKATSFLQLFTTSLSLNATFINLCPSNVCSSVRGAYFYLTSFAA